MSSEPASPSSSAAGDGDPQRSGERAGDDAGGHDTIDGALDERPTATEVPTLPQGADGPVAFLIVREGGKWRDVFRLTPGQVTTVGRAPTNRIVIADEVCSRNHCEIFLSGAQWTLRDLDSRNGTLVDERPISGDHELQDGQVVRIGSTHFCFTYDLSRQLPEVDDSIERALNEETAVESAFEVIYDDEPHESEPAIIARTRKSRFLLPDKEEERDRTSRELANLYRLALDMGAARTPTELAAVVLEGLFHGTVANIGAILLFPEESETAEPGPRDSVIVAYETQTDLPYQKVSDHLSRAVLESGEAILARDVSDDSRLASRDSLGEIHAKSVICAPIRKEEDVFGLVHLYSTSADNPLDPEDLEFTLAVADQMAIAVVNLREKAVLEDGLARAREQNTLLRSQLRRDSSIVGESAPMQKLREEIARLAPTDATSLVRGESGVGKELVARAIHFGSQRRDAPIVCMNCAALSESLLESELFGHEKGSFTGATERKAGKFEQADGGTLFLDEVGEMSLAIQAKFLRVLEGHPFERVGGRGQIKVDVRVVAATNRNLETAVKEGKFRSDLYFRLQVVEIVVPPLRERRDDIALLAVHFLDRFAKKSNRPVRAFSRKAFEVLAAYDWPGNVRQLQNTVERAVVLTRGDLIEAEDIQLPSLEPAMMRIEATESAASGGSPPSSAPAGTARATDDGDGSEGYRDVSLNELEKEHILATLEQTGWNKSKAAQILGIERSTLDRKLKRYKVSRPS